MQMKIKSQINTTEALQNTVKEKIDAINALAMSRLSEIIEAE